MLPLLLACVQLDTPDGPERVRGALWIEEALPGAPGGVIAVVANSPLPCAPDEVVDDPATADVDEAAAALLWWYGELRAAVQREDAALVAFWLGGEASEGGAFELSRPDWLSRSSGVGGGLWYRVLESALANREGPFYEYEVIQQDSSSLGTGTLDAEVGDAAVDLSFDFDGWSGAVSAERCSDDRLAGTFARVLAPLLGR